VRHRPAAISRACARECARTWARARQWRRAQVQRYFSLSLSLFT